MKGRANNYLVLRSKPKSALATPQISNITTPSSSTFTSAYTSEDEDSTTKTKPFPFARLPSELRNKIYSLVFACVPDAIDLDPSLFKLFHRMQIFALFRVSRQIYLESVHNFFSTHTFRIFPTYPGKYFKTKKPLLARLPARARESLTSLQLRVGPGWNNPPQGWVVNEQLGLRDCTNVRVLKVFVECDPSDAIFAGFRKSEGFYERFCKNLLEAVLRDVPSIQVVEFDAYSSVSRTGDMMSGLGEVVARNEKVVAWGAERGWDKESDRVWLDAILMHGGSGKLSKSIAVFA
ncbi:hypothetical protein MBM_03932 [Drepanopeziza brunnea f. sp. 'multigermtubi' MB_m1]|uniref:Uncharacterized protein n=1 Tax=Marssonina brunnea f. sp. multigermtubi (strain MB_m1) TaxID=1072389 RepID=K1WKJ8_MARBU|nr:uncharacterized protein MBM_03932 [Drepanopeziza brunnea f. sp. 'multigermtubi' MB_m1]EKD18160.1 hypothetical protein MBM_03932 [Drepanopeziza brunnea f. sp. 'multigermtubi' MB_m1]